MNKHSKKICFIFGLISLLSLVIFTSGKSIQPFSTQEIKDKIKATPALNIIENDLPKQSSLDEDWSYTYGDRNILSYFPITTSDGSLVIIGSQMDSTKEVFAVSFPSNEVTTWGSSTDNELVDEIFVDSNEDIVVFGNRDNSTFIVKYSLETHEFTEFTDIIIGDSCWFMEMHVLDNSNYLVLIKYLVDTHIGLRLFEINSDTLEEEWVKDYVGISTFYISSEIDEELTYIQRSSTGKIVLTAQNSTEDGIFLSIGDIEGSWTNFTILGNSEICGCVMDKNDKIHLASRHENPLTSKTVLEVLQISLDGLIEKNCSLASTSMSYKIQRFTLNEIEGTWNLPFLVYSLIEDDKNQGLGWGFIDGNSIETSNEFINLPSDVDQYRLNEIINKEGAMFLSITKYGSSTGVIKVIRAGETKWTRELSESFTNYVSTDNFQISANDDKIWFQISDLSEGAGIYSLNIESGTLIDQVSIGRDAIYCDLQVYDKDFTDYLLMYGLEGDVNAYDADAVISIFETNGNELNRLIREDSEDVNEKWEWAETGEEEIFVAGLQLTSEVGEQTLIVGHYNEQSLFTKHNRDHDPIKIYSDMPYPLEVGTDGITRGSGTQADPYIIEFWNIVDDDVSDPTSFGGIIIWDRSEYFVIANCTISGFIDDEDNSGIGIFLSEHIKILNNNISDCTIGIDLESIDSGDEDNIIANNTLSDLKNVGIGLGVYTPGEENYGKSEKITITQNEIDGVESWDGGDWDGVGILLTGSSQCTISYNTATNCEGYGIVVGNGSEYTNTIVYNDLCGNTQGGILIDEDEDTNDIHDNECGLSDNSFKIPGFSFIFLSLCSITMIILLQKKNLRQILSIR